MPPTWSLISHVAAFEGIPFGKSYKIVVFFFFKLQIVTFKKSSKSITTEEFKNKDIANSKSQVNRWIMDSGFSIEEKLCYHSLFVQVGTSQ